MDDAARQQKAVEILEQLKIEGVLLDNPDFGKGGRIVAKYIVNSDYSEASDEVGEHDLETRCPHCGDFAATHVLEIEKRNGTVKCDSCGKGYVAMSHQLSAEDDYHQMLKSVKTNNTD